MNTRLDRILQRARAPLSALRPVVRSAYATEQPFREDVEERWGEQGESREERAGAPPSAPGPVAPSAYATEQPLREDAQVNGGIPTPSRSERENAAGSTQRIRGSDQRVQDQPGNDQQVSDQRVHEASLLPQMEPPRVRPALLAENGARSSRDEAKLPVEKSRAPQPAEQTRAGASKRSVPDDIPTVAGAASPLAPVSTPRSESRESRATRVANEFAAFWPHAKPADARPPHAWSIESRTESPVESLESPIEINVSIGSIDFRSARPAPARKRSEAHPRVTLENYLQRGKRDGR
jgi:hypothetical protein